MGNLLSIRLRIILLQCLERVLVCFLSKRLSKNTIRESIVKRLKKGGCDIGENVHVYRGCNIDVNFGPLLHIENDVTISSRVTILAHDASLNKYNGCVKIANVHIGKKCFVGSGSIILAGTDIGDNCIIGAGSVVRGKIPDNSVVIGNPAQIICNTDYYERKYKIMCDESFTKYKGGCIEDITRASRELGDNVGFLD